MANLRDIPTASLVGLTALAFSALYIVSDVIEAIQGAFSGGQLGLTLIAEAAIPVFVIGLYLLQRPQIGRLGQLSAAAYAYSYMFFTGTVVYALIDGSSDYTALSHDLQPWMTIHGAVMVLAGLGFGFAVIRAEVLPRWTGIALMAGVVFVSLSQTLPEGPQVLAAAIRDLGFAGMGAALLGAHPVSGKPAYAYPSSHVDDRQLPRRHQTHLPSGAKKGSDHAHERLNRPDGALHGTSGSDGAVRDGLVRRRPMVGTRPAPSRPCPRLQRPDGHVSAP